MKFSIDNAIEYPVYLRDRKTAEVWEFRNSAELQALETDEELADDSCDAYDSSAHKLSIHVSRENSKIALRRTSNQISPEQFTELRSVAVW
jgi:hypothetical protein